MGWAGPSTAVASNTLITYVQLAGALMLAVAARGLASVAGLQGASVFPIARHVFAAACTYAAFIPHPGAAKWAGGAATSFRILALPAAWSLATALPFLITPGSAMLARMRGMAGGAGGMGMTSGTSGGMGGPSYAQQQPAQSPAQGTRGVKAMRAE